MLAHVLVNEFAAAHSPIGAEMNRAEESGRDRFEADLIASVHEATRVTRPDGSISFLFTTRDEESLADFLRLVQREGIELQEVTRLAATEISVGAGEPYVTHLLIFRKSRRVSVIVEPTVNTARVLELSDAGAPNLFAGLAAILQRFWTEEDVEAIIPEEFKGSRNQRVVEFVATHPAPEELLRDLGLATLRQCARQLAIQGPETRDGQRLARAILESLGFSSPASPEFSFARARREIERLQSVAALADEPEGLRGASTSAMSVIEEVLRHATDAWATAGFRERADDVLRELYEQRSDKPFRGLASLTMGEWKLLFMALPTAADSAHAGLQDGLRNLGRSFSRRKIDRKLNAAIKLRNDIEHNRDGFLEQPNHVQRDAVVRGIAEGLDAVTDLQAGGGLPRILTPVQERRDRYGRMTLVLDDEVGRRVELFVTKRTDLAETYVWFPSGTNPREVDPALVPLRQIRGLITAA